MENVLFSATMEVSIVTVFALEIQQVLDVHYAKKADILGPLAACLVWDLEHTQEHP